MPLAVLYWWVSINAFYGMWGCYAVAPMLAPRGKMI